MRLEEATTLSKALSYLDSLEVEIGYTGGRRYKAADEKNDHSLQEIMDKIGDLEFPKNKPTNQSSLAWQKLKTLNEQGEKVLKNSWFFQKIGTFFRRLFNPLMSKELRIWGRTHLEPPELTVAEINYIDSSVMRVKDKQNGGELIYQFLEKNNFDERMLKYLSGDNPMNLTVGEKVWSELANKFSDAQKSDLVKQFSQKADFARARLAHIAPSQVTPEGLMLQGKIYATKGQSHNPEKAAECFYEAACQAWSNSNKELRIEAMQELDRILLEVPHPKPDVLGFVTNLWADRYSMLVAVRDLMTDTTLSAADIQTKIDASIVPIAQRVITNTETNPTTKAFVIKVLEYITREGAPLRRKLEASVPGAKDHQWSIGPKYVDSLKTIRDQVAGSEARAKVEMPEKEASENAPLLPLSSQFDMTAVDPMWKKPKKFPPASGSDQSVNKEE